MKKRNRKEKFKTPLWQKIVIVVNSLVIIGIIGYYAERLFRYKNYFETIYNSSMYDSFSKVLINNIDLLEEKNGLFENEDGTYTFRNQPTNNYVLFGNQLYRILGIDKDDMAILVSENAVTRMCIYEHDRFENTSLFHWLNPVDEIEHSGQAYNLISEFSGALFETGNRFQIFDDLSEITADITEINGIKVSTLSAYDYLMAGGTDSFLNNGTDFWLSNCDSDYNYYYVDSNGALGIQNNKGNTHGVRIVIKLSFAVTAIEGKGTISNPYVLTETEVNKLSDVLYGSYVSYGNNTYRVISQENGCTELIMDGFVKENDEPVLLQYGDSNQFTVEKGLGKYLNTDFLDTLPDYQQYLVEREWTFGTFGDFQEFSYLKSYDESVYCYVFVPNQSMLYLNDYDDYYLSMAGYQEDTLVYTVKGNNMYSDFVNEKHYVRPVICMKSDLYIVSGNGTEDSPFAVSLTESGDVNE